MQKPEPKLAIGQLLSAAAQARSRGDIAAAEQLYRRVIELDAAQPGALHDLGVIATLAGRLTEALEWYRRALRVRPDAADTHNNMGAAYKDLGDPARAIEHLSEAIRLRPDHSAAHNNLGSVRLLMGDLEGALAQFARAAELDPRNALAWSNMGRAACRAHGAGAALEPLSRAWSLAPGRGETGEALAAVLCMLGRYAEAMPLLEQALALSPERVEMLADLVHIRQHVCDWAGLKASVARVRDYVATAADCGVSPFFFMVMPGTTALEQRRCAEQYARRLLPGVHGRFAFGRQPRERLRVGYLAAHFHDHATLRLLLGVLEHHDRARFDVIGISIDRDSRQEASARARGALDGWLDLRAAGDEEAARAIHARGIDILIDGHGYSRGARPGVLAQRPAPVQAGYLVYPGTTGADFLDYLIADRFVIPPELADAYTERVRYLPDSYQCTDDTRAVAAPPARRDCGLPDAGLVFCCFNQTYKITPQVFDVWCRLLRAVPGSVLWLWASNSHASPNLRREAQARGIAPERLIFCDTVPNDRHLARIALADLFVDTFPCNAHTTASDALWGGVPVLTCAGETFVSRAAGSVLRAAGLPDLVTGSLAEYEAKALALARDPAALAALRQRVAASRASPLFDTAGTTRALEALYEELWRDYVRGPSAPAP